ncbi:MAG: cobyrinate a,c-diamide synthase [Minwuia sp.]|uniref:cobyrinate a,c-diamide synthase n=1 Tax=Minwuia sp. TaxID=2493630 RepID=UPI003A864803
MQARGFVIAAPASGAGKSTVTAGLLRAFRNAGVAVAAAKCGPDYIDPMYHAIAAGAPSVNLDPWAMDEATLRGLAASQSVRADLLVVEGVMGLFDGARDGTGSTADLAAMLGLPVLLLVDASHQAQSLAALVHGFNTFRSDVGVSGVIFNHVGAPSHAEMIEAALKPLGVPVLGAIPRDEGFSIPSRHLGLVPAAEIVGVEARIAAIADAVSRSVDLDGLRGMAAPVSPSPEARTLPPPGQRVAVASDIAFCFAYPHVLEGWRRQGAEIVLFSPLADEGPDPAADAVWLPGGYPELHGSALAGAENYRQGMRAAAERGTLIHGECGGYMALGEGLTDAGGGRHAMIGLLPLETSFEKRRLHLGYRRLKPLPGAPWSAPLKGHEFHYTTILSEAGGDPLFDAETADGRQLPPMGRRIGRVSGSFAHLIA